MTSYASPHCVIFLFNRFVKKNADLPCLTGKHTYSFTFFFPPLFIQINLYLYQVSIFFSIFENYLIIKLFSIWFAFIFHILLCCYGFLTSIFRIQLVVFHDRSVWNRTLANAFVLYRNYYGFLIFWNMALEKLFHDIILVFFLMLWFSSALCILHVCIEVYSTIIK